MPRTFKAKPSSSTTLPECPKCKGTLLLICGKCGNKDLDGILGTIIEKIRVGIDSEADAEKNAIEKDLDEAYQEIARLKASTAKLQSSMASSYTKGKAQQLSIIDLLEDAFPHAAIEAISDGKRGADVLITFIDESSYETRILIESKNATTWGSDWLHKLHKDKIEAKADLGILVTRILNNVSSKDYGLPILTVDGLIPFLKSVQPLLQRLSASNLLQRDNNIVFAYKYMTTTLIPKIEHTIAIAKEIDRKGINQIKQGESLRIKAKEIRDTLLTSNQEIRTQFPLLDTSKQFLLK